MGQWLEVNGTIKAFTHTLAFLWNSRFINDGCIIKVANQLHTEGRDMHTGVGPP